MKTVVWVKPIGATALEERPMMEFEGKKTVRVDDLNKYLNPSGWEYSRTAYMDMAVAPDFAACVK